MDYVPPSRKEFSIRSAEGNERGTKVVRRVLEHEANMAKGSVNSDFCTANYDFAVLGQETLNGRPVYVLQLKPKHETVELLRGKAWVDAESFLVVRAEGEPAKSPSWWIKDLKIAIDYGRADGVWLPFGHSRHSRSENFGHPYFDFQRLGSSRCERKCKARPAAP